VQTSTFFSTPDLGILHDPGRLRHADYLARSAKLPTGLYILLALISIVFSFFIFNDFSETNSQDPLDRFSQSFHRMKAFWVQMNDLDLFCRYPRERCHDNQFCEQMANSTLSSLWHSETEWYIALYMQDLIAPLMPLYPVKFW